MRDVLKRRIAIRDGVAFSDLGDEGVILEVESGRYFGLDEVGTRIWSLVAEHGSLERVFESLLAEYDVDREQLRYDLLRFTDLLVRHRLVVLEGPRGAATDREAGKLREPVGASGAASRR